jgi:hypothetical protein
MTVRVGADGPECEFPSLHTAGGDADEQECGFGMVEKTTGMSQKAAASIGISIALLAPTSRAD